jgi:RNA polymerase sigma-70 factor (ECF subfamily)
MKPLADHVVETYGPAVVRIAASYERDAGLREELAQDMLLAILLALPRLREPQKLRAYIFRIAHNRAMRHIIARVRAPVPLAEPGDVADSAPNPEQALLAEARGAALLEAVRQLPLPYRQVITLLLEDLSYAEIADVLGLSQGNVGVRINRAKHQLRKALDHDR